MDLLKRREEILGRQRVLESVPGSGYHPSDPDSRERQARGEAALSARPIAIQDDDRVCVVGDCVQAVRAGLRDFLDRLKAAANDVEQRRRANPDRQYNDPDLIGHGLKFQASVVKCAGRALAGGDAIELPTQDWNYCVSALTAQGILCVITDAGN